VLGHSALAAAALVGGTGVFRATPSGAQQKSISAVLPGVIMTDKTRAIIDQMTGQSSAAVQGRHADPRR